MKFSGYYRNAQTLIAEQTKKSGSTTWDYNQLSLTHKLYSESEGAQFPYNGYPRSKYVYQFITTAFFASQAR